MSDSSRQHALRQVTVELVDHVDPFELRQLVAHLEEAVEVAASSTIAIRAPQSLARYWISSGDDEL